MDPLGLCPGGGSGGSWDEAPDAFEEDVMRGYEQGAGQTVRQGAVLVRTGMDMAYGTPFAIASGIDNLQNGRYRAAGWDVVGIALNGVGALRGLRAADDVGDVSSIPAASITSARRARVSPGQLTLPFGSIPPSGANPRFIDNLADLSRVRNAGTAHTKATINAAAPWVNSGYPVTIDKAFPNASFRPDIIVWDPSKTDPIWIIEIIDSSGPSGKKWEWLMTLPIPIEFIF